MTAGSVANITLSPAILCNMLLQRVKRLTDGQKCAVNNCNSDSSLHKVVSLFWKRQRSKDKQSVEWMLSYTISGMRPYALRKICAWTKRGEIFLSACLCARVLNVNQGECLRRESRRHHFFCPIHKLTQSSCSPPVWTSHICWWWLQRTITAHSGSWPFRISKEDEQAAEWTLPFSSPLCCFSHLPVWV